MKLVYTILGTYNSGGMERVLANKVNYLAKIGFDITIVTTDQKSRPSYFEMDATVQCIDLGINYTEDLNKGLLGRGISIFKKNRLHKYKLEKLLKAIKPAVTISMFDNDASFITDISDGSKKVVEIHFSRFKRLQYGRSGVYKWIDSYRSKSDIKAVQKFDRFVVLTNEDKGYWGELPNIQVIPNANSFVSSDQAQLKNKSVLAVGRFDYQKGFDELIKIWALVSQHIAGWTLNIYGQGPLKTEFEALIQSLGLSDSIFLHEPTKDIKHVFLEHSILVMTSRYEGLPMVLLEGQVCGLPMVSYACKCGPRDIISNGENGFLVPEGEMEQFANKVVCLMKDEGWRKQMGERAYENSKNYTEEVIMQKWIDLFDELTAG